MNHPKRYNEALAMHEGWLLANDGERLCIQRYDDGNVFESDEDALRFVKRQASFGDMHAKYCLAQAGYDTDLTAAQVSAYMRLPMDAPIEAVRAVLSEPEPSSVTARKIRVYYHLDTRFCPYCSDSNVSEIVKWTAHSLEPHDLDNTATLTEYQCMGICEGRSFWT